MRTQGCRSILPGTRSGSEAWACRHRGRSPLLRLLYHWSLLKRSNWAMAELFRNESRWRYGIGRLSNGDQGSEIEALEPGVTAAKTGRTNACLVTVDGFRNQHVLQCGALLAYLEIGITLHVLELVVHVDQQVVDCIICEADLFRQDQDAAGLHAVGNALNESRTQCRRYELQGEVEDNHRGLADLHVIYICAQQFDEIGPWLLCQNRAETIDHGRRVVHCDQPEIVPGNVMEHGQ